MKKNFFFLCSVLCFGLCFSCQNDDVPGANCNPTADFPYLEIGNKWTYNYSEFFSGNSELTYQIVAMPEPGYFTVAIGSQSSFLPDEGTWYSCGESISGLYIDSDEPEDNVFALSNPVVGDSWSNVTDSGGVGNYEVVETDVSVTTPAGTFLCDKITYHQPGTINTDTIYESTTIGRIKYVGLAISYELKAINF